jgi:hypothetical protein
MKITDKIKSFEDACAHLNISTELPIINMIPGLHAKSLIAYYKLIIIIQALNEGWVPNWLNNSEYKWFNWFYFDSAGFACSYSICAASNTHSHLGSRLCFKSEELTDYAREKFEDLYKEYLLF